MRPTVGDSGKGRCKLILAGVRSRTERNSTMKRQRSALTYFGWLNATQFLGAMNDNLFRFLVLFFLVDHLGLDSARTVTLATVLFVMPFLIFSQAAGVLADACSKRNIIVLSKVAEVAIMTLGLGGLLLGSPGFLLALVFAMSTQSAFFGPVKYGILPELVSRDSLSRANGRLVSMTYLAIILGTFLPSFLLLILIRGGALSTAPVAPSVGHYAGVGGFCLLLSVVGLAVSLRIARTAPAGGTLRFTPYFATAILRTLMRIGKERYLLLAVLGSAYFLFLGGIVQQNVLIYGREMLGWTAQRSGFLFPMAAVGIALGALAAGALSGRNIEFGIVPVGAFILTACSLALGLLPPTGGRALGLMLLTGIGSGLFIVPLGAYIQDRSPAAQRGEVLAASNFLSFLGVAVSAGLLYVLVSLMGFDARQCFLVAGAITGGLALLTLILLPDFTVRFCIVLVTRLFYRVRPAGLEHLPLEGGALLVSNHVTSVDALLIASVTQRRIRFLVDRTIYRNKGLNPLFRLMGAIPVSSSDPPHQTVAALRQARDCLDAGFIVCVFAEGALTRNGNFHAFRTGFERIVSGSAHPVLPVHIGNAWGSIFSCYPGRLLSALPRLVPRPVTLRIGAAMGAESTPFEVRQAVAVLGSESFVMLKRSGDTLGSCFVRSARRHGFRHAMGDTTGKSMSFGKLLIGSVALADALRPHIGSARMAGVLMPASVGGALANLAVVLLGRVPVNLNFTASAENIDQAIQQCEIGTVISSRAFLEKLGDRFRPPRNILYLEDVAKGITSRNRLAALVKALCVPSRVLAGGMQVCTDDLATVIFSSGSTGEPKGVMLSHFNILSNIEQLRQVFHFTPQDGFASVLPFFHSFGLTVTLWAPLICGFSTHYHPNPLEGARIGKMVREHGLSIMVATPTFLQAWLKRAHPDDFATLRALVTGAEKLSLRLADAFEQTFGICPVEGYGATELSPVVSLNLADVEVGGVKQTGTKKGSVGHLIPGVAARLTDIESEARPVPPNVPGLLQIKGPNVMRGYLDMPEKTADVLHDGWYMTGDIARMDEDGFLFLEDRLSRFSKIGGEMVPHLAVEDTLQNELAAETRCVAVVAVPDAQKGEKLVVCCTPEAGDVRELHRIMMKSDLPNLWKPKKDNYMVVEEIPTLGSGKIDMYRLKQMARAYYERAPRPPQPPRGSMYKSPFQGSI